MPPLRLATLTTLSMLAFAGNSLLCRAALKVTPDAHVNIDVASFTTIRLIAGAVVLWLLVRARKPALASNIAAAYNVTNANANGNWISAFALFAYAICFSYAYAKLPAATGALLLFGAVQATMIGVGIYRGERLRVLQLGGLVLALGGLAGLLVPDPAALVAPPLYSAALMLAAGIAWGVYSLRGKGARDATRVTAGNFMRTVPFAVMVSVVQLNMMALDAKGVVLAIISGAITSGVGYAIWYSALPALKATTAATVQLSVPVIATFGGVLFLQEAITWRMVLASVAILGGIALVIIKKQRS